MGFHEDAIFPTDISYGSSGGPGFNTAIIRADGGEEEAFSRWSQPLHQYNARYGLRDFADLRTVNDFFLMRRGAANGFRYQDPFDFTSHPDTPYNPDVNTISNVDQQLGVGDGSTTTFQLVKNYSDGSSAADLIRPITKPVSGTVVVALDSVDQSSGWSINTTTGELTFDTAPGTDVVVTAGFQFHVPCRFGEGIDKLLATSLPAFEQGDIPDIPIEELRQTSVLFDDMFLGGGKNFGVLTGTQDVTLLDGRVLVFEPTSGTPVCRLPELTNVPAGGPVFIIVNEGSVSLGVVDSADGTVVSGGVAASGRATLVVSKNAANAKTWYAY